MLFVEHLLFFLLPGVLRFGVALRLFRSFLNVHKEYNELKSIDRWLCTYFLSSKICGPIELFSLMEFVARLADEKMARRFAR